MQAEHFRGNGFITSTAHSEAKYTAPKKKTFLNFSTFNKIPSFFSEFLSIYRHSFPSVARSFSRNALSVTIALSAAWVFSLYFTFGTGIYQEGKLVAVARGEESYVTALASAKESINKNGLKNNVNLKVTTAPAIVLKSKISNEKELHEKLLLSSGKFIRSCTAYCNGTPIFTAQSLKSARNAVENYINLYSMDGNARLNMKIEYKNSVVEKSTVSSPSECEELLKENDAVSVVSVVNTVSDKAIPFDTQTQKDSSLFLGETVTVTEGKEGKAKINVETVYENGAKQSSRIIDESIIAQPVSQVVRIGTKPKDVLATGVFYPLTGTISSNFGSRWGRMHEGIDIAVSEGTPVIAAECGTVSYAGEFGGYGNFVKIDHGNGVETAYAHLSTIKVKVGQTVNSTTQIALSGNTGRSTGPHLHFEIIKNSTPLDPGKYLKKR